MTIQANEPINNTDSNQADEPTTGDPYDDFICFHMRDGSSIASSGGVTVIARKTKGEEMENKISTLLKNEKFSDWRVLIQACFFVIFCGVCLIAYNKITEPNNFKECVLTNDQITSPPYLL